MASHVRKDCNWKESLSRYESRLRESFAKEDFGVFDDKFISTYRIYSTVKDNIDEENPLYCDAFVIYKLAKEYGYNPRGICSERVLKGSHVSKEEPCVYIGKYCYNSGLQSSKFRILPKDKVFRYSIEE